jgi:glucose/arabinose dehydrogenase
MAFLDNNEFLVGEICGGVWHFKDNLSTKIVTLPVSCNGEGGLLYILPDPAFDTTKHLYISYVADRSSGFEYRISRFTWTGMSLADEDIITTLTGAAGHIGGAMTFGPPDEAPEDQKLFIVTGDLGWAHHQTSNHAQGTSQSDASMIIRINKDGSTPSGTDKGPFYDVAEGNPHIERMYAYGIRNSFGLSFDPLTNYLWDTENAPDFYEEINLLEPGMNSGWYVISGPTTRGNAFKGGRTLDDLVHYGNPPVSFYSDPEFSSQLGLKAPTSIVFFTTSTLGTKYINNCLVAGFGGSQPGLYYFKMNSNRDGFDLSGDLADNVLDFGDSFAPVKIAHVNGITDMKIGPDGYLYIVSIVTGKIMRLKLAEYNVTNWELY